MRLVLTDQDLSGTIEGQPFSYIGRCTGSPKFVGDWTHVSLYGNNFVRPDWSEAKTRWSYSRFNTFTDGVYSQDIELLDHEMINGLLAGRVTSINRKHRKTAQVVVNALSADKVAADYMVSWSNLTPDYMASFKSVGEAESVFRRIGRRGATTLSPICTGRA
jgi:hypothetical protein